MTLVEHLKYKGMYYLMWSDGSRSTDFYSLTWAKDHLKRSGIENYTVGIVYMPSVTNREAHWCV